MAIVKSANLRKQLFKEDQLDRAPTRHGFGYGLMRAAKKNKQIVALSADLTGSVRMAEFAKAYPSRFFEVGVAEQNLVTVAAGLAAEGKVPFCGSFATFSPGRNWEQIRTTVCYNDQNVNIVGSHAGISTGADGATHQALEDVSLMRTLPNMDVVVPCDVKQAEKVTLAVAKTTKPTYIRLSREKTPVFTTAKTPFTLGKADVYHRGKDVTIIATGLCVYDALVAAHLLRNEVSVEVINLHTIMPLDAATILKSVKKTGRVITVEEHQVVGGTGSAVAELLSGRFPAPVEIMGVEYAFGESGSKAELWKKFKLDPDAIAVRVKTVMKRKKAR